MNTRQDLARFAVDELATANNEVFLPVQTVDALGHVEQAEQDKAETLERAIVASIRAVAQYCREKEERIAAVLDEVARDPDVISIAVREEGGDVVLVAGQPLGNETPGSLERTRAFEVAWQCHGGPGHGAACGDLTAGRYELVLRLDPSTAAQVRSVILLEAGAVSLLLPRAEACGIFLQRKGAFCPSCLGRRMEQSGAVTVVQRTNADLRLNPHLHSAATRSPRSA